MDGNNAFAPYLVSKLALLFVAILKRTWLASWDDPLLLLLELYHRSLDSRLLILQILRYVVEDVCLSPEEPMPGKRKKLLSQMLMVTMNSEATLKDIYPEGIEWLETLPGWTKWGVPGQVGFLAMVTATVGERVGEILSNGSVDAGAVREISAAIKFLQVCIPWGQQRFESHNLFQRICSDDRSLVDIDLLQLLHQSLLVNNNDIRTTVLDTLYVLTTRSAIPIQDTALIRMRREAFSEDALQGYSQVLDQIFADMITNVNGQLDIDREIYGVGKKFVMVRPPNLHTFVSFWGGG
jgi:Exportin 1-like protein